MIQKDIEVGLAVIHKSEDLAIQVIQTHCHGFLFYSRGCRRIQYVDVLFHFIRPEMSEFQKTLQLINQPLNRDRCRRAISYCGYYLSLRITSDVARRENIGKVCLHRFIHQNASLVVE